MWGQPLLGIEVFPSDGEAGSGAHPSETKRRNRRQGARTIVSLCICAFPAPLSHHHLDGAGISSPMVESEDCDFIFWL